MTPEHVVRIVSLGEASFRRVFVWTVRLLLSGRNLRVWLSSLCDLRLWTRCARIETTGVVLICVPFRSMPRLQPLWTISCVILLATLISSLPCRPLARLLLCIVLLSRTPRPILRLDALMLVEPLTVLEPTCMLRRVVLM